VTQLLIRNLDDATKQKLTERAARHGRSVEVEVQAIIEAALRSEPRMKLGSAIREIFEPLGGVDLPDVRDRSPTKPIA
jgi:plasmid stability protein